MFVFMCNVCGLQFISDSVPVVMRMPNGFLQTQFFNPNCPSCMQSGRGPGFVQCLGQYIPAPMRMVQSQPVYDRSAPMRSPSFPSSSTAPPTTSNSNSSVTTSQGLGATSTAVVKATTAPVVRRDWSKELAVELTNYIMGFLDERSLAIVSQVCKHYRTLGIALLQKFAPPMVAYGSSIVTLKDVLANELRSVQTVNLAVDKFSPNSSDDSILSLLITQGIKLSLTLGEQNPQTLQLLRRGLEHFDYARASRLLHKMHNKFWVLDREGVITGSPNVSFSGLEGGNSEAFIVIRSPRVAALFIDYLRLLRSDSPFGGAQFDTLKSALAVYNSEQHQLKLAMAPVINITDFVLENLEGASKIIIRQFLISPKNRATSGKDILTILCGMAESGVEIEVYLDEGQYQSQGFVKNAVGALLQSGCKVFLQKPVLVADTTSEGLMHDKLILATLHSGVQRTLLGSAGFTIDVIANRNAENFICTDVKSIYDTCLLHHKTSLEQFPPKQYVLT